MRLRTLLPPELQMKVSFTEYKQAYQLLKITEELKKSEDFFLSNTPLVNVLNGVYDANRNVLLRKSPQYGFKNCLQANFDPNAKCKVFHQYLDNITGGDAEMKHLWRVVFAYTWSHYNNAKSAVLIYGPPHTGKSVICNLIERFVGSDKVSHVDIALMHKGEYITTAATSVLNIVPDLKNDRLGDLGYFKSLVSHLDTITARRLYSNTQELRSQTKCIFATNHLLQFDVSSSSPDDLLAVFNRFLYLPILCPPIQKGAEDKHLVDKLWEERDGILTWALQGLQYYIDAGENFPVAAKSEEIKQRNMASYCPEMSFCNECLREKAGAFASSKKIREAYNEYCITHYVKSKKKLSVLSFIDEHLGYGKTKGRVKDENGADKNIWYYKDVELICDLDSD